jgi:hypothetical protein
MKSNMYQQVYISFASGKIFSTFTSYLVIIITRANNKNGHYFEADKRPGDAGNVQKLF